MMGGSTDGGRSWTYLALGNRQVLDLAVDPSNEDIIYAGVNLNGQGAIYVSRDGGDTWQSIETFRRPVWSIG